jgi:hypothetical protein
VRVRLPGGVQLRAVTLLVSGATPVFTQDGDWVELVVPSILDHEVVAMDV